MIDKGFCGLCGRKLKITPYMEDDGNNHIECLEKLFIASAVE